MKYITMFPILSRAFATPVLTLGLVLLIGCKDAEIRDSISSDINGFADDGDSNNPRDEYRGGDLDAADNETRSSSETAKFNELAGRARAIPTDPSSNTLTSDVAQAASYNKVTSELVVTNAGQFTFNITQTIEDIELVHDGTLHVGIRANILTAQGQTITGGDITSLDYEMKNTGEAKYVVEINGDTNNPDSTTADKKYNKTASGPSGGIQLVAGNYQIELELRIRATAPIQVGPDGRKHEARVGNARVKIELR